MDGTIEQAVKLGLSCFGGGGVSIWRFEFSRRRGAPSSLDRAAMADWLDAQRDILKCAVSPLVDLGEPDSEPG